MSVTVELNDTSLTINGKGITFPVHLNDLTDILGKHDRREHINSLWRVAWDDLGIYCDFATWDNIYNVLFFVSAPESDLWKLLPKSHFSGTLIVDGKTVIPENLQHIEREAIMLRAMRHPSGNTCFGFTAGKNFAYKEEIPKDKYKIKPDGGKAIVFSDFNFKLLVIEELMYNQELLKPKFDLYEFAEIYDKRKIDIEEEGYAMIPEAVEYFRNLPVSEELAGKVTELYQDGGNDIYGEIFPFWDGEDDTFDIKSYEDVKHFPNLKKMVLFCDDEKTLNELRAKGIEAQRL